MMSDIAACPGNYCPIKGECYRYTFSKKQDVSLYFIDTPYDHENNKCEYIIKVK